MRFSRLATERAVRCNLACARLTIPNVLLQTIVNIVLHSFPSIRLNTQASSKPQAGGFEQIWIGAAAGLSQKNQFARTPMFSNQYLKGGLNIPTGCDCFMASLNIGCHWCSSGWLVCGCRHQYMCCCARTELPCGLLLIQPSDIGMTLFDV